jgi:hypothetical protein
MNNDDEWTKKNTHALGGVQTHGLSTWAIKAYASDCMAIETRTRDGLDMVVNEEIPSLLGIEPVIQPTLC